MIMKLRTVIGIVLIVAGTWKLANLWGIIENDWLWRQPWTVYIAPALLLYIGASTIVDSFRRDHDQWLQRPIPLNEDGKRISCSVHYGGDEYVYHGEHFRGARLDAFCGGIRLDLREATITEDEEIDIHTFCGGIELLVPNTVNVEVKSRSFIGGVGNHTDHTSQNNAPCLHIIADNFIGGVSIKNK
jgi:predicted membrane protein